MGPKRSNKRCRSSLSTGKEPDIRQPSKTGKSKLPTSNLTRLCPSGGVGHSEIVFVNESQASRYDILSKRNVVPTRYLDEPTLKTLGLYEDVMYMFDQIGCKKFVSTKNPTYKRLTLEFLSTLTVEVVKGKRCEKGYIGFRLYNNTHQMDLARFNSFLSLPTGGDRMKIGFSTNSAWYQLAGTSYDTKTARSNFLSNPCIKYAHRVLSNTIFARGESDGVVRMDEVFFFTAMLKGFNVDVGSYIARQMIKIANTSSGKISIGGLITTLALKIGYDVGPIAGLEAVEGPSRLDLDHCILAEITKKIDDVYCLPLKDSNRKDSGMTLPLPKMCIVALSRVTSKKGLNILICGKDGKICTSTNNLVYKEVFQNV